MLPERFRSSFSPATLTTVETQGSRLEVRKPLFFRTAYTAYVIENERRSFQPLVVLEGSRAREARCSCAPAMRPHDLCRHVAVMIARMADAQETLPSERFEASVWRSIGFAAFSEGREIDEPEEGDGREQLLRKHTMTAQEQALLERGSGSTKLLWERSPWYRWAKRRFLTDPAAESAVLLLQDGAFVFDDVAVPASAVEALITAGAAARGGFEVVPESLQPALKIDITGDRALRFVPLLLDGPAVYVRSELAQFGRWFLAGRRFASARSAAPLFAGGPASLQSSFFDGLTRGGVPVDRITTIPESEVFAFVERHREELAAFPEELAPECIRNAQPVTLGGDVVFDFTAARGRLLELELRFESGVTGAEIVRARRDGVRALNRGNVWVDVADPQLACLDPLTIGEDGRFLVTKLELVRIRGSLRGRGVFRGDPACEAAFRLFEEMQEGSDAPSPAELGFDLYTYQQTGYRWLWRLRQHGFGALLCDDMGLGKTHQAMALIAAAKKEDPEAAVLVVAPTSVLDHWREKLARYLPGTAVTLTSYGLVRNRIEQYRGRRFDLVVLDEMQTIKNADTSTHQALRLLDKGVAVGLTGTPIENHEGELKALLDFAVPGYLPAGEVDRQTLRRLVRPFVLRRTKEQVLTELPPKIVDRRYCEMGAEQRALYRSVLESRAAPLRAQLRAGAVSYVHVFAALNYLKQVCNHPASAGGGFGANAVSAKWELFTELVDECMSSGLKVVVFSQYLRMLELIEEHLRDREIGFASIKGATRNRGEEVSRFRSDASCRVFTASLRAGGLGIDLTSASVVIHYDRWWNQAREDQATDRVHRLGQTNGVQVIKLITRGTVEEKIDALIARKAALTGDVIEADDPALVKQFTVDELDELLGE